jgi:hypothetical protein
VSNKEIAFTISMYDKMYELSLLVDVLRLKWGQSAYINVVTNNLKYKEIDFAEIDIDNLIISEPFALPMTKFGDDNNLFLKLVALRIATQMSLGFRHCYKFSDAPFTMHLHADSWPFSKKEIKKILAGMSAGSFIFGAKGYGFSYAPDFGVADGHLQDFFLIVNNLLVDRARDLYFDPMEHFSTDPNIHGIISKLIKYRFGANSLYIYSDLTDIENWQGEKRRVGPFNINLPLSYDPVLRMLHIERNMFMDNDFYYWVSYYLKKNNLLEGRYIQKHLKIYNVGEDWLDSYKMKLDKKFSGKVNLDIYDTPPRFLLDSLNVTNVVKTKSGIWQKIKQRIRKNDDRLVLSPKIVKYQKDMQFLKVFESLNEDKKLAGVLDYDSSGNCFKRRLKDDA